MDINMLMAIIEQYGYVAIFFLLWLGIVGLPIPDELVVATGGFLASIALLNPVYSFVVAYLGVASGLTIGFLLGKWFGKPILQWLSKKEKMHRSIVRSTALVQKYGTFALCFSYLFPVVRHLVPYIVAMGGMTFRRYAALSYPIGLVWTTAFYLIGYVFGRNVETIIPVIRSYGFQALFILLGVVGAGGIIRWLVMTNRATRAKGE
ncbi:DedA family protein [Brevibacillus sp. H7]|jgi:membrane-associated protein|uniref:DedA family protein n=1 Tax=Brevibacillus sp. H7 TaxID=3349138 RepID=UPI00382B5E81